MRSTGSHYHFFKKASAVILSSICFVLVAASLIGIFFAAEYGFYTSTQGQVRHDAIRRLLTSEAYEAYHKYESDQDPAGYYEGTNFRFIINDENDSVLASNYDNETVLDTVSLDFLVYADASYTVVHRITAHTVDTGADIFRTSMGFIDFVYVMRFFLIAIAAVFSLGLAALWVYLLCAAGHRPDCETVTESIVEKIPFDVYALLHVLAVLLAIVLLDIVYYAVPTVLYAMLISLTIFAAYLLLLAFLMSLAVRLKMRTLLKNTLIYIVCAFLIRKTRALLRLIPSIWMTAILLLAYFLFDVFVLLLGFHKEFFVIAFMKNLLLIPIVLYVAIVFRKLKTGAEIIEGGDLKHHVETEYMLGDFGKMGKTLNNIAGGLNRAVEERIRSERMKTELITNVSHDIKTPLTSIINYTDLLKKENIANETARDYVEVIDRQATRLKKLITDLVEASKASTGNIQVNSEPCDVGVLLQQAAGEYDEKLHAGSLRPILHIPEEPVLIHADGRLLWRVFDNLLSNICKYALEGTRVYLDAAAYGDVCIISFKNISRTELDVNTDELTERFVRADSSRSTEGNGLGLSIAQSLTELQGGSLTITADGDLFKACLQFPLLNSNAEQHD